MKTKFSPEDYVSRIESNGYKFVRWIDDTRRAKSKVEVICPKNHHWTVIVDTVSNNRRGCWLCAVASRPVKRRLDQQECINKINAGKFTFIKWVNGEYRNCDDKATVVCELGHQWDFPVRRLIHKSDGCPICSDKYRYSGAERAEQINKIDGISFVRWSDGEYRNASSKAVVKCHCGYEWSAKLTNLIHGERRCPSCAKGGFDSSKRGAVYLLRSDCGGMCKIGISNIPKRRMRDLENDTPFPFKVIEICWHEDGRIAQQMELDLHRMHAAENAGLTGFSGCTEWFTWSEGLRQSFVDYRRSRATDDTGANC